MGNILGTTLGYRLSVLFFCKVGVKEIGTSEVATLEAGMVEIVETLRDGRAIPQASLKAVNSRDVLGSVAGSAGERS